MKNKIYLLIQLFIALVITQGLIACAPSSPDVKRNADMKNEFTLALVWAWDSPWANFGKGAQLAAEEINANGGLLNKIVKLKNYDDHARETDALDIAQHIISDPKTLAVIGHPNSYIAKIVADNYRWHNLILFTPATSTEVSLTNTPYVYHLSADDQQVQNFTAHFILHKKIKKILLYYENSNDGRSGANEFEKAASALAIDIIDRRNFELDSVMHASILSEWKSLYQYDALMIIANTQIAPTIIKAARNVGITQPIFMTAPLILPTLNQTLDSEFSDIFIVTNGIRRSPAYDKFINAYQVKYKQAPDLPATSGYDSVYLIAYILNQSKSVETKKIIKALHKHKGFTGFLEEYSYTKNGNIQNPTLAIWEIKQGKVVKLEFENDT